MLVVFGIGALKLFDQSFIVSRGSGGPVYSTYTPVLYIYNKAFKSSNFGLASSAGVVMFVGDLPAHARTAGDRRPVGGRLTLQTSVAAAETFVPPRPGRIAGRAIVYLVLVADRAALLRPVRLDALDLVQDAAGHGRIQLHSAPVHDDGVDERLDGVRLQALLLNSLFLAVVVTTINLFLAALGGYAFARLRFPGRELLFLIVLGTLMIPTSSA